MDRQKREFNLEMKLFVVLSFTGMIANSIGFISNALLYGMTSTTLFILICAIFMTVFTLIGMMSKKTYEAALMILTLCNVIEFPILYYIYGPYYLFYMVLGIVSSALFLKQKWRKPVLALLLIFDGVIITLKILKLSFTLMLEAPANEIAILVTYFISMTSVVILIVLLMENYQLQQKNLKDMAKQLEHMANLDSLTGLYNRRYLISYLNQKMVHFTGSLGIVLIDLDDFKMINDHYGHVFGDETLQFLANTLIEQMKDKGIATRFGGEEFMLVFNQGSITLIQKTLQKIAKELGEFGLSTKQFEMSFSAGVEIITEPDDLTKLFNLADHKLYEAKNNGKHQVVFGQNEYQQCF